MKCFVVSDVHGYFDQMAEALYVAGFDRHNPEHLFISCGDLLDRGSKPKGCLDYVNSLERKILIRGNHEDLMDDMIKRGYAMHHDFSNGTVESAMLLADDFGDSAVIKMANCKEYNTYRDSLIDYAETSKYIFVHGWIPCNIDSFDTSNTVMYYLNGDRLNYSMYDTDWRDSTKDQWRSSRWINGMDAWSNGLRVEGKTILCGHWHTSWGYSKLRGIGVEFPSEFDTDEKNTYGCFDPFEDEGICALDGCTAFTHKVNCKVLDIPDKELEEYIK